MGRPGWVVSASRSDCASPRMPLERGIVLSCETMHRRATKFGPDYARRLKRKRRSSIGAPPAPRPCRTGSRPLAQRPPTSRREALGDGFIESFNARLRDKRLVGEIFYFRTNIFWNAGQDEQVRQHMRSFRIGVERVGELRAARFPRARVRELLTLRESAIRKLCSHGAIIHANSSGRPTSLKGAPADNQMAHRRRGPCRETGGGQRGQRHAVTLIPVGWVTILTDGTTLRRNRVRGQLL